MVFLVYICDGFACDFVCDVENPCEHEEKKKVKIHANMRENVQFNKICMLRVNPCQRVEKIDTHHSIRLATRRRQAARLTVGVSPGTI
jgi:hypothetical protein